MSVIMFYISTIDSPLYMVHSANFINTLNARQTFLASRLQSEQCKSEKLITRKQMFQNKVIEVQWCVYSDIC